MRGRPVPCALNISRLDSSTGGDSSNGSSPSILAESGKFKIGGFEIGRDGVTELPSPSHQHAPAPSADEPHHPPPGIDFNELQPLQIIGRGASGFVRRAEHLPSGRSMAVKEICISDPSRRQQILKEIETLRAATARYAHACACI